MHEDLESLDDILFEAMFGKAVRENFEQSLNELPSEEKLSETLQLSEFHEERMKKLFAKDIHHERIQTAVKRSKQVVASITVITTVLFGAMMFTKDVRADVIETIIYWTDGFTHFFSHESYDDLTVKEPKYIPEDYTEIARIKSGNLLTISYTDKSGANMLFTANTINGYVGVSNVDTEYEQIMISNVTYHVFITENAEKLNYIVWDIDGYRYYLSAPLSIDTLMEIAQSI